MKSEFFFAGIIKLFFLFSVIVIFNTFVGKVQAQCYPAACAAANAACQGLPVESACTRGSCSSGGPDCNAHESPPNSNIVWGCSCSASTGTPTPPPGPTQIPTATPTLPIGCPSGYSCMGSFSCLTGDVVGAGQACINYAGSSAVCCGPRTSAPTATPAGPGPTSPPAGPCGGGAVTYCPSGGGWYCCGSGMVCIDPGGPNFECCPSSSPYFYGGTCHSVPQSCPAYGSNYTTYCSGNTVRESYANGSCGTTDNLVTTCASGCSGGACTTVCPGGAAPGDYCNDFCTSCGVSTIYTYNSSCQCVSSGSTYSQPICNGCGSWCPSSPSCVTPPPPPTSTPPTPSPSTPVGTCGPGAHSDSCLCGGDCNAGGQTGCCADGTSCQSTGPGYACLGAPPPPPPGCSFGADPHLACVGFSCQAVSGCGFDSCSSGLDCSCGNGVCDSGESFASCPADCTYSISGKGFIDYGSGTVANDGNGVQNCSGVCNNGAGDEPNYSGGTVRRTNSGGFTQTATTASSGTYSFNNNPPGTYTMSMDVPAGYIATNTNPRSVNVNGNVSNVNFGIRIPPPSCSPPSITNSGSSTVQPGQNTTLSVTSCVNVTPIPTGGPTSTPTTTPTPTPTNPGGATNTPTPPGGGTPTPTTFVWNPNPGGATPTPTITGKTETPTSSTITWEAPVCPTVSTVYTPSVTVNGPGGSVVYSTSITVPATYQIGVNVRVVNNSTSCLPTDGTAYQNPVTGTGATINVVNTSGSYSINQNQVTTTSSPGTSFACLPPNINYQVSLQSIPGYSIVRTNNNGAQISPGSSPITITNLNSSRTITYCIAPIDPWFQTTTGDARFVNLSNPIPAGLYGSVGETPSSPTSANFPGIFYSSESNAQFGFSGSTASSIKRWVVNNEYSYNAETENRNGGMSYDFFKAKALKDGVAVRTVTEGTIDLSNATTFPTSGVYEVDGTGTITGFSGSATITGKRIVLLAKGTVRINQPIHVTSGNGLFILASLGDITIDPSLGTPTYNSTATDLEGIYTSQGNIVFESIDNKCETGVPDKRLNVGGSIVANSLKPFSSTGTGQIKNNRSLCISNLTYPPLYVAQRADFLTQLTDFYKTTYTKWKEVNP